VLFHVDLCGLMPPAGLDCRVLEGRPCKMSEWTVGTHIPKSKKAHTHKSPLAPILKGVPPLPTFEAPVSTVSPPPAPVVLPQPFPFERPKLAKQVLFSEEPATVTTAPNSVTLNLPQMAWASLGASLSTHDLGRCVQVCKGWRLSIATSVRVVTLWADGAKIKQLRAIVPNVEKLVFADAMSLMHCGEEDLPTLLQLQELHVLAPPQVFPSKLGSAHDAAMVEFCLIAPHLPRTLTSLSLPLSRISRGSLSVLEKLTSLTHLDLSRGDWRADAWNWTPLSDNPELDDWVDFFPPGIVSLNLAHCHVLSDRMMKKFAKRLPKLRVLNVENCFQLTDVGISSLPATVEELDMTQCIGVFRKGDARLGVLPSRLSWLRLSFNFNDHFVGYIPATLTALLLEKSFVTDSGMKVILGQLKNLLELSCAACINIGDATLALLPPTLKV
jgi:hypothetical protein